MAEAAPVVESDVPQTKSNLRSILIGAAFLMATSAVGPGFLTQTAVFTSQLGASFGFAILISVLFDLGAQLNIWRVIAVADRRAQDVANTILPGLGTALAVLVSLGGLAFNIGNIAGAGLGLNAMLGITTLQGALISAVIGVALFLSREAGRAMDRFAQFLGFLMVGLTLYVAVASHPPLAEAAIRTIAPTRLSMFAIVTIVGGTVGGYITFAGAHRLLDAGVSGRASVKRVTQTATTGILVASAMRVLLFLAALGVVSRGFHLDPSNPPASVFRFATGEIGYRVFGVVMWSAAITSVVGSAYTSVSFLRSLSNVIDRYWTWAIIVFIALSTVVFVIVGQPVRTLIVVGALNGLILPISLGVMLVASRHPSVVGSYRHSRWLTAAGLVVMLSMATMGVWTIWNQIPLLFR
ncbi:MAG TPA: NRAMP family divalent metal transporter [Gemmatimonadaceae bacterium]|jgi:Mn2+/Fe2+ NRAMP family transporter